MATKIRAVVVGGGWGRNHALAYQQHPDAELLGIIGRVGSEKTRALAREMQVPVYLGLAETLEKLQPDVLSCAAGEADHEEVTVTALEAGCHVCCEKLLADTVAGAERMVAAAQRTGRQLMCSYNYRFSPSALKLRELVESGELGHLAFATAFTFGYCLHHTLDLVCSLLGSVEEVYCVHRADPPEPPAMGYERYREFVYSGGLYRSISLKFTNGALATLISSDYMRVGHPAVRVDLVGSKARANMADIVGTVTVYREDRQATVWMPSLILDRLDLPSLTQTAVSRFIDAIRDGQPVPVPGEDGLDRLRIERALLQSAQENRPVRMGEG
jgi:predicted dehydrogenase